MRPRPLACALVLLGSVLAGCAGPAEDTAVATASRAPAPEDLFLIDQDFPDPDVLPTDDGYLAFATNSPAANVQIASSADLVSWTVLRQDALPSLPEWATTGRTWAPTVFERPDGTFVLYFVAEHLDSGRQCIGAATSTVATGPYAPTSDQPTVCTLDTGGAIDPSSFLADDGTRYLLWKDDGNCCGLDTWIRIAPLTPDGLGLASPATPLIRQTEAWEGDLVEAPVLVEHGGAFALLYSANNYASGDYAVGVATSSSLLGPYTKAAAPILTTHDSSYIGPGGQAVVQGPGGDVLFFHSWDSLLMYRGMASVPLEWDGATPSPVLTPAG